MNILINLLLLALIQFNDGRFNFNRNGTIEQIVITTSKTKLDIFKNIHTTNNVRPSTTVNYQLNTIQLSTTTTENHALRIKFENEAHRFEIAIAFGSTGLFGVIVGVIHFIYKKLKKRSQSNQFVPVSTINDDNEIITSIDTGFSPILLQSTISPSAPQEDIPLQILMVEKVKESKTNVIFDCKICGREFKNKLAVTTHSRVHKEKKASS